MPRLRFKKEEPLRFKKMPPETGVADQPDRFPDLGELFAPSGPRPPAEPGMSFGAQAVERAGRLDALTPPVEPPLPFGAQAVQRAGRIDELQAQEPRPFDPEADDYDYDTASQVGGPDETGHWFSLDPRTGMVLKGRAHPTFDLTLEEEHRLGNKVVRGPDGRYYSRPAGEPDFGVVGAPVRVPVPNIAPTFVPSVHSPDPEEIDGIMGRLGEAGARFGVDVAKEFSDIGNLAGANVNAAMAATSP